MKRHLLVCIGLLWAHSNGLNAQVVIDSLKANGQLTVTVPTNADFTVEWADSLVPEPEWRSSWIDLNLIHASNGTATVEVPMFYRVNCWTNGLLARAPFGRTYTYAISNAYDQIWMEQFLRVGQAMIPAMTNRYQIMHSHQQWTGDMPAGAASEPEIILVRLTDQSLFVLDPNYLVELEVWRKDEIGTTWTNDDLVTSVEAYEDVAVPAGTFTNCLRLHQRYLDATETNSGQRIWIKPGFMEVQSVQYADWTDPPEAAPIVWQLQSWSDN